MRVLKPVMTPVGVSGEFANGAGSSGGKQLVFLGFMALLVADALTLLVSSLSSLVQHLRTRP